jgi:hypothetical protein
LRTRLVELPFRTFGDIVDAGWRVSVHCPVCHVTVPIELVPAWRGNALRGLCAFHARFCCTRIRTIANVPCARSGHVEISPPTAPEPGARFCTLWCGGVRHWQIYPVFLGAEPFPAMDGDQRFRCPGCGGAVQWSWPSQRPVTANSVHLLDPAGTSGDSGPAF